MRYAAGVRLGPYEILGPLGSGGMGEVYRARDTRLDRTVALKVLAETLAVNEALRERFEREARTISQLNHPHICTLHDVGRDQGADFLVMEYLEGQTLAVKLASGPIPVDQAIRYAIEIADALDKAHRLGIVHRDLKPGNVMLTTSGAGSTSSPHVKLLDFGLAKLTPAATGGVGATGLPTTPANLTAHGTILGTYQYMAPEQLEGKDADTRSDIFAFGAVLYEMITGHKPFDGASQASVIAAILDRDPPPMTARAPATPPALDRVVKTCLAKDPDERFQSAHDLLLQLRWMNEVAPASSVMQGVSAAVPRPPRGGSRIWIAGAVAMVVAVLVLAAVLYVRQSPATTPEMRVDIVTPSTTDPISFAISPDGRRFVFVASGNGPSRLWLRPLDAVTAQPLPGTEGATYPFWSPDGKSVAFFASGKLKRIDIGGGLPQVLADAFNGRGGTWNAGGVILFTPGTSNPISRVPAAGGQAAPLTKLDPPRQTAHRFPWFLPDGKHFLFYAFSGRPEAQGIYISSLDAPDTMERLTAADTAGQYAPPGWLLFVRQGTLMGRRFDSSLQALVGDPITIADQVGFDTGLNLGAFSVSAAGMIGHRRGGAGRRQLTWFDRSGRPLGILGASDDSLTAPTLSPDARRVAAHRTVQGNIDVWVIDPTRTTRFTFDDSLDRFPIWSPDGSRIVFESNRMGVRNIYQKPSSGAGMEELLSESQQDKAPNSWSPDGRFLAFSSIDPKTQTDLWVLPMQGDRKPFVFVNTPFDERSGMFSPDGRWIAYLSNQSGQFEIYVRPFPPGGGQWQASTGGGIQPRWKPDGKELYYIAPDGKLMAVPIAAKGSTLEPGTPTPLFQTHIWGGPTNTGIRQQYDVAADGRFLISVATDDDATSPVTLLLNWKPPTRP